MEDVKDAVNVGIPGHARVSTYRIVRHFLLFLVMGLGFAIFGINIIRYFGVPIPNVLTPVQTIQKVLTPVQSIIKPCFEEPSTVESWIRAPSSLSHAMNDTELIWRASFVPRLKKYPFRRIPKIAFIFLAKGMLPLAPLWERFFKGHEGLYSIYIHSLPSYSPNYSTTSVFYGRQIPSQSVWWGSMSMCDAERRLLANALLDISNEWFILLSEACIPLRNFSIIHHYISRSWHSFMGAFDDPGPVGRGRYDWRMMPEVSLDQWRKGAQWFEVSRELAVSIVEDTVYYPKFSEFCINNCYPDEHYFPTMLTIQVPHLLANRTLTWVDWSRGGPHPGTFGEGDVSREFFMKRILESQWCDYNYQPSTLCVLFARKFAPSALDLLLEIAWDVFGF